jgi:hypothetical protein
MEARQPQNEPLTGRLVILRYSEGSHALESQRSFGVSQDDKVANVASIPLTLPRRELAISVRRR